MSELTSDSFIKWKAFSGEKICERFPLDEWNLMVSDISSDEEWHKFLKDYKDLVKCYVLYTCKDNNEIGFVYLYNEADDFNVVSIHGGGWGTSVRLSILYYRGLILMIENLVGQGKKVRTSCFLGNDKAYKFLRGIGFVNYMTTDKAHYMWINNKKLQNSKIYRYINREM